MPHGDFRMDKGIVCEVNGGEPDEMDADGDEPSVHDHATATDATMTDATTTDATTTDATTLESESTKRGSGAGFEGTKDVAFDGGSCEDVGALLNAEAARSASVDGPARYVILDICPTRGCGAINFFKDDVCFLCDASLRVADESKVDINDDGESKANVVDEIAVNGGEDGSKDFAQSDSDLIDARNVSESSGDESGSNDALVQEDDGPSEYEMQRKRNIARNNAFLVSIGLAESKSKVAQDNRLAGGGSHGRARSASKQEKPTTKKKSKNPGAVSYTHLTLPTILLV